MSLNRLLRQSAPSLARVHPHDSFHPQTFLREFLYCLPALGGFQWEHEIDTVLPTLLRTARFEKVAPHKLFGVSQLSELQKPDTSSKANPGESMLPRSVVSNAAGRDSIHGA
jgi:hypothetical protein